MISICLCWWIQRERNVIFYPLVNTDSLSTFLGEFHDDLRLTEWVKKGGLTESMLKTKCIDKLLYSKPLTESFHESTEMREQEVENIVTMLSKITDYLVERGIVETLESAEIVDEVRRRFFKQASLVHVSSLMRRLFERECFIDDEDTILSNVLTEDWLRKIDNGIKNIARHPVWTAALDRDEAMKKVKLALEKNQNVQDAFHAVGLNLAYAILGEKDEGFRKLWR